MNIVIQSLLKIFPCFLFLFLGTHFQCLNTEIAKQALKSIEVQGSPRKEQKMNICCPVWWITSLVVPDTSQWFFFFFLMFFFFFFWRRRDSMVVNVKSWANCRPNSFDNISYKFLKGLNLKRRIIFNPKHETRMYSLHICNPYVGKSKRN